MLFVRGGVLWPCPMEPLPFRRQSPQRNGRATGHNHCRSKVPYQFVPSRLRQTRSPSIPPPPIPGVRLSNRLSTAYLRTRAGGVERIPRFLVLVRAVCIQTLHAVDCRAQLYPASSASPNIEVNNGRLPADSLTHVLTTRVIGSHHRFRCPDEADDSRFHPFRTHDRIWAGFHSDDTVGSRVPAKYRATTPAAAWHSWRTRVPRCAIQGAPESNTRPLCRVIRDPKNSGGTQLSYSKDHNRHRKQLEADVSSQLSVTSNFAIVARRRTLVDLQQALYPGYRLITLRIRGRGDRI